MKIFAALPLVGLSAAFVLPEAEVMNQVAIESRPDAETIFSKIPAKADELVNELGDTINDFVDSSKTVFDQAIDYAKEAGEKVSKQCHNVAFDAQSWIESAANNVEEFGDHHGHHGHHGHDHKPNQTVYELISKSKYTTKLAALINEYEDIVELLNGTSANFTVFAPTGLFT